jgi:hypothetical protein
MKVHIGKYLNWVGPYQIADALLFFANNETKRKFGEWLALDKYGNDSNLAKFCEWVYSKRKRKLKIRIDEYDVWSADSTLAAIILPVLRKFKERKQGSPSSMTGFWQTSMVDNQYCFPFYANDNKLAWDSAHTEWDSIVDKMIWSFEQLQPEFDWEEQYLGNFDKAREHEAKIQEGLDLFGKHFRDLWT